MIPPHVMFMHGEEVRMRDGQTTGRKSKSNAKERQVCYIDAMKINIMKIGCKRWPILYIFFAVVMEHSIQDLPTMWNIVWQHIKVDEEQNTPAVDFQ